MYHDEPLTWRKVVSRKGFLRPMTYLLEMQANVARRDATGVLVEAEGVGLGPSRHLWGKELVTVRGW